MTEAVTNSCLPFGKFDRTFATSCEPKARESTTRINYCATRVESGSMVMRSNR